MNSLIYTLYRTRTSQSDTSETISDDNTTSPKCGLAYADDTNLWICCDGCNVSFDLKCTAITSKRSVPDMYYCEDCQK